MYVVGMCCIQDQLVTEMYSFFARESELSHVLLSVRQLSHCLYQQQLSDEFIVTECRIRYCHNVIYTQQICILLSFLQTVLTYSWIYDAASRHTTTPTSH